MALLSSPASNMYYYFGSFWFPPRPAPGDQDRCRFRVLFKSPVMHAEPFVTDGPYHTGCSARTFFIGLCVKVIDFPCM